MDAIKRVAESHLPTEYGDFKCIAYRDFDGGQHLALVKGRISRSPLLVRVHSQCLTGDTLGSIRCDCGDQLDVALKLISENGGILLYMQQEGRGIGLVNKIKAYNLQDEGLDTAEANERLGFKVDERNYTVGAQMLADLGVRKIKLLTNNPKKIEGLNKYKLKVVKRVRIIIDANDSNKEYLKTKKEKLGHLFEEKGIIE